MKEIKFIDIRGVIFNMNEIEDIYFGQKDSEGHECFFVRKKSGISWSFPSDKENQEYWNKEIKMQLIEDPRNYRAALYSIRSRVRWKRGKESQADRDIIKLINETL